ncbi:MAG: hypothetical protein OXH22_02405 [Chloroflexi bacterium]|nr:hypothetical protein [Chloroflexota bacterium]
MYKVWVLLLLSVALYGCASEAPVDTPTPLPATPAIAAPTAAPTAVKQPSPSLPPAAVAPPSQALPTPAPMRTMAPLPAGLPDIECQTTVDSGEVPEEIREVRERLGYAVQPSELPAGFSFGGVSYIGNEEALQIYQDGINNIIIAYPMEFSPDSAPGSLQWERPAEAVSAVRMGDQTAYLMIGGWSDASIIAGPALSPDKAEWDFEKSLALFFRCTQSGGRAIDVAIQALPGPIDWIDAQALVDIAYSLERVTGN